jgi:acyl-CoA thioesterase-1
MGRSGNVREVMRLMQPDGLHPTAEGVALNVAAIGPSVLELVERARARQ